MHCIPSGSRQYRARVRASSRRADFAEIPGIRVTPLGYSAPVLRIHTSHRTEDLLDALVENLAAERGRDGAWTTVRLVVPNGNVETYLRRGIAERAGIAANIETPFLRKFLGGLANQALPDAHVADAAAVEGHLLALLHDDALLARADLAAVRGYLMAAGAEPDAVDRRRCQLAAALARLFDEYAGSRPEMLEMWRTVKQAAVGENPLEVWQRALWLAIFGPGGRLDEVARQSGVRWLPLDAMWAEAMNCSPRPFAGRTVHVFGLSYIATAYHRMLARLARESEVHVYTLNPCREEASELRARPDPASEDPYKLAQAPHPALALWARPGRENLRLLSGVEGAKLDFRFPETNPRTLLQRLQNDIVTRRAPEKTTTPAEPDGSLAVQPCPSLRRELEVVAAEIWNLLRKDQTLRMCDVAVIVPEARKALYLAQLPAVFGESCHLPHSVADLPAASSHRAAEAIALLIELPFSSFSRKDFLPLLTHPCLMARFPSATPEAWRELAAQLGIVRGASREDWKGTYLDHDLFSWDQGLSRLALGAVADIASSDAFAPMALHGEPYLPGPAFESDDEARLGFGLLARSLVADAAFASREKTARSIGDWVGFIHGMVKSYVVLDDDDETGRAMVDRFVTALDALAENGLANTPVSYRVAAELAKAALDGVPWNRGHYRASGVTVASFVPMRAIPFRAVFVLGLGQDAFPQSGRRHELDLRTAHRRPGDVDGREQDLYMFLETLLSAREQVTLSYVSRNEITGDELPASPALLELRSILGRGYLEQDALARLFRDEPGQRPSLRRYDDTSEHRQVLPPAEAEHRVRSLGKQWSASLREAASARKWLAGLSAADAGPLARALGLTALVEGPRPEPATAMKIRLTALRRFLEDPLQGSARFSLGMSEDEDEGSADVDSEPFDMGAMLPSSLLRRSMSDAILARQGIPAIEEIEACHEQHGLATELAGRCPTGFFRTPSASSERQILRAWHQELHQIIDGEDARCRTFRFVANLEAIGEEEARPGVNVSHRPAPSLDLELPAAAGRPGRTVTVSIVGETKLWVTGKASGDSALSFTTRARLDPKNRSKEDLAAFLEYVVLTASGAEASRPGFRSALFSTARGSGELRCRAFGPLTRDHARDYLGRLCADLLVCGDDGAGATTSVHAYLLPHEAVLKSHARKTPLHEEIQKLCAGYSPRGGRFSSVIGPVPAATERYAPPASAEAERMVKDRFGLFFALCRKCEA